MIVGRILLLNTQRVPDLGILQIYLGIVTIDLSVMIFDLSIVQLNSQSILSDCLSKFGLINAAITIDFLDPLYHTSIHFAEFELDEA